MNVLPLLQGQLAQLVDLFHPRIGHGVAAGGRAAAVHQDQRARPLHRLVEGVGVADVERARPAALAVDLRHGHRVHAFRRLLVALMQLGPELSRPFADGIGGEQLEPVVLLHPQLELQLGLEDADHHRVARTQALLRPGERRGRLWRQMPAVAFARPSRRLAWDLRLACSGCVAPLRASMASRAASESRPVDVAEAVAGSARLAAPSLAARRWAKIAPATITPEIRMHIHVRRNAVRMSCRSTPQPTLRDCLPDPASLSKHRSAQTQYINLSDWLSLYRHCRFRGCRRCGPALRQSYSFPCRRKRVAAHAFARTGRDRV